MRKRIIITDTDIINKIIEKWKFYKNNSIAEIAKEFDCSEYQIHQVINNHLKSLNV